MGKLLRMIFGNFWTKLLALLLAGVTWGFIYLNTVRTLADIKCPLEIEKPAGTAIIAVQGPYQAPSGANYVVATFEGSESALGNVGTSVTAHYTIREQATGQKEIPVVSASDLVFDVKSNIKVARVSPEKFTIVVDKIASRFLPVTATIEGEPAAGYRVAGQSITPTQVSVRGPASILEKAQEVSTEPINVSGRTESFEAEGVRIVDRIDDVRVTVGQPVNVKVEIAEELVEVEKTVYLQFVMRPGFEYRPVLPDQDWKNIKLLVPKAMASRVDSLDVRAYVDLKDITAPGTYPVKVSLDLPQGVVYQGSQIEVTVEVTAPEEGKPAS